MSRIRPPSPSMAVAIAGTAVASVGTAVASVGTISVLTKNDKKQIKKIAGRVADQRVRSLASGLTVASAASAGTAEHAKAADFATRAGNVPEELWAIVHADGTLYRGSPGIVGSSAESDGKNTVVTDRDLRECFFVATLGGESPGVGLKGEISVNPIDGEPNAVYVRTGNEETHSNAARPFTLLIGC